MKNLIIYGIFSSRDAAENGVSELKSEGFMNSDVSILFSSPTETMEFVHENSTTAPEVAATVAISGATIGGVLGWLAGIGTLAIPGVGPFIAAGPIMAALAGAGVGGTIGGLTGALVGMGIPEYEAKRYEDRVNDGGVLVAVHAADSVWEEKAKDILKGCGAEDISSKSEESGTTSHDSEIHSSVSR